MKTLISLTLTIVVVSLSSAQPKCDFQGKDSLFTKVNGDTIVVSNLSVCAYCSATFRTSFSISADTLYVVQTDTAGRFALCDCLFDLRTSIVGVPHGTYWVVVYRDLLRKYGYSSDVRMFVGSSKVNYAPTGSPSLIWESSQSGCNSNSIVQEAGAAPGEFFLFQNFPNPFNPVTTIRYTLSRNAYVKLAVYDILGREVVTLVNNEQETGNREIRFDGSGLASGVYFCRLEAGSFVESRKLHLVK